MALGLHIPLEILPLILLAFSLCLFTMTLLHLLVRHKLKSTSYAEIPARAQKVNISVLALRYGTKFSFTTRDLVIYEGTDDESSSKVDNLVSTLEVLPLSNWLCSSKSMSKLMNEILDENYASNTDIVAYHPIGNEDLRFLKCTMTLLSTLTLSINLLLPIISLWLIYEFPDLKVGFETHYSAVFLMSVGVVAIAFGSALSSKSIRMAYF